MNDQNVAGAEILQCFLFGTRHAQIAAGGITIGALPLHQDIAHQMHLEQVGGSRDAEGGSRRDDHQVAAG